MLIRASLLSILLTASAAHATACYPSDIKIKNAVSRIEHGFNVTVGEIVNNCPEPTGAQLQIVYRDAKGDAVDSEEFWPAGANNIAPNASFVFKWISERTVTSTGQTVKAIAVKSW